MDENDLIHRLHGGYEDAFEHVFKKYFAKLCLYANYYIRDKQAAEEIVEDFFYFFWSNAGKIVIKSSLDGYLYMSIHNRCLKYLRQEKVRQRYIERRQYVFTDQEFLEPVSDDYPEASLESKELEDKITEAINSLPEQCRNVFSLSRFEDLSYAEISFKLGISINTVKTQMVRALQKLRLKLKD